MPQQKDTNTPLLARLGFKLDRQQVAGLLRSSLPARPADQPDKKPQLEQEALTVKSKLSAGDRVRLVLGLKLMFNTDFNPAFSTEFDPGSYDGTIIAGPKDAGLWLAVKLHSKTYMRPLSIIFSNPRAYQVFKL